jgi:hypothetical protein
MVGGVGGIRGWALVGFAVGMSVVNVVLVGAGVCCVIVVYVVEWGQSGGALVRHGQSKGFEVLLSSVGIEWMQDMLQGQFCV